MRKYYGGDLPKPSSFMSSDGRVTRLGNRSSRATLMSCCSNNTELSKEIRLFPSSNWALPFSDHLSCQNGLVRDLI
ncbi:hypothetical protein TNCT_428221 [Trichonephila clavata]|uniref:Uncharacterized protein n=1 Tax=Trichonephila clavata TaxID=2740835 RepID=A0A8X6IEM1_TRICU|nr:hypothetical protein TNCT_428221 [Trichonephila clavata]